MTDFTKISRSQWLELAQRLAERLERNCAGFTASEWECVTPYLGWRARDVLAHMTSAMPVNFRQVLDRALAGNPGPPPEFDTFTRNAREVKRRRNMPVADLRREFRNEFDALMATYRSLSDGDWLKPAWFFVGPVTVRTLFLAQLGDNVLHERDLLLVAKRWQGLDPEYAEPLVDWFMRDLRPANFRPERAKGLQAAALYRLRGPGGGEWTLQVSENTCAVEQGAVGHLEVTIEGGTEKILVAAQARAASIFGRLARKVDWICGASHAEEVVAKITGYASLLSALRRDHAIGSAAVDEWRVDLRHS